MEFLLECSTRYLTSSLRSLVRYRVEHDKQLCIILFIILAFYYQEKADLIHFSKRECVAIHSGR